MSGDEHMAYAGYCTDCGGMVSAVVDGAEFKRDTAKFVAAEVRAGNRVERVTCQFVRDNLHGCTEGCACRYCAKKKRVRDREPRE